MKLFAQNMAATGSIAQLCAKELSLSLSHILLLQLFQLPHSVTCKGRAVILCQLVNTCLYDTSKPIRECAKVMQHTVNPVIAVFIQLLVGLLC